MPGRRVATHDDLCETPRLVEAPNQIGDPRFREASCRTDQKCVGETVHHGNERIRYVCPGPGFVSSLMSGVIAAHRRMETAGVHPVLHAALVGYGFVFVHPFEDGNARIHRLLIHNMLARRSFVPSGMVFPVSAVMLKRPSEHDASLEAFSKAILRLADYELDDSGRMTVRNGGVLAPLYRYPDMTAQVEALFAFIERTVETELAEALSFLASYDRTKRAMQEVVDLPDRELDLFIRLCLQNQGKMSKAKRDSTFRALKDDEVAQLERCVSDGYGSAGSAQSGKRRPTLADRGRAGPGVTATETPSRSRLFSMDANRASGSLKAAAACGGAGGSVLELERREGAGALGILDLDPESRSRRHRVGDLRVGVPAGRLGDVLDGRLRLDRTLARRVADPESHRDHPRRGIAGRIDPDIDRGIAAGDDLALVPRGPDPERTGGGIAKIDHRAVMAAAHRLVVVAPVGRLGGCGRSRDGSLRRSLAASGSGKQGRKGERGGGDEWSSVVVHGWNSSFCGDRSGGGGADAVKAARGVRPMDAGTSQRTPLRTGMVTGRGVGRHREAGDSG